MISYQEALLMVQENCQPMGEEQISIEQAPGRVLSQRLIAKNSLPPFDTSAVDGYAVLARGGPVKTLAGEMRTGAEVSALLISEDEAVRVFTGSKIPVNSEAIVMVEDTALEEDQLTIGQPLTAGQFIRRKGLEVEAGQDLMLHLHQPISPAGLGWIAASGNASVWVRKNPRISIVEIGDELQTSGQELSGSGVNAVNGMVLEAECRKLGLAVERFRSGDDLGELSAILERCLSQSEVTVTTGGVSVGKYDLTKRALSDLGVEEIFWRVAIRPGKPIFFGRTAQSLVFGLPGNPVSSLVTFRLFVIESIKKLLDVEMTQWQKVRSAIPLETDANVDLFLRATETRGIAAPVGKQESHMISSLANSNILLHLPRGLGILPTGSRLDALAIT